MSMRTLLEKMSMRTLLEKLRKRFTKSNQESDRPLSIDKDKKVIELTKDEFG